MKNIFRLLCFLSSLSFFIGVASCRTGSVPPVVSEGIETGIDCAKESIAEIARDNILHIEQNLLLDNWKDQLKSDALRLGQDVVACVIEYIVSNARRDLPRASSDVNTRVKISRGDEWIVESRARFKKTLE